MELLGETRTATYTFQTSLQQKQTNDISKDFDSTLKMNVDDLDFSNFNNRSSTTMRAPYSAVGTISGRYGSTANYRHALVLSEDQIPKMKDRCKLTTLNSAKMSPEFLNVRNGHAGVTTDTKEDWKIANNSNLCSADRVLASSGLMREDALRICSEVCERTKKNQRDSTKRLDDRTKDVGYWKNELQREMDKLICDIKELEKNEKCFNRALHETNEPLKVLTKCLGERKNRVGIDLVDDDVDKEIRKGIDIIKRNQVELKSHSLTLHEELGKNNDLLKRMSNNITCKFTALNLDNTSKKLTNTSQGLMNYIKSSKTCVSGVETWVDETCLLVRECQGLCASVVDRTNSGDRLLTRCAEWMNNQWREIWQVLSIRISEYLSTKSKLESQLEKVLNESVDADKMIEYIKKNIKDLSKPLRVAQARISLRSRRPISEDCYDPAHEKLSKETMQIGMSAEELEAKLQEAIFVQQELLRTKRSLEHDLQVKVNSLFIDEEKCLGLMRSYDLRSKLSC